jgi:hypothetical protein
MLFVDTAAVYCENHTDHTDTVRTSQETRYVSATEPNRLMLSVRFNSILVGFIGFSEGTNSCAGRRSCGPSAGVAFRHPNRPSFVSGSPLLVQYINTCRDSSLHIPACQHTESQCVSNRFKKTTAAQSKQQAQQ